MLEEKTFISCLNSTINSSSDNSFSAKNLNFQSKNFIPKENLFNSDKLNESISKIIPTSYDQNAIYS